MRRLHVGIAVFAVLWLSSCCAMPKPRVPGAVLKTRWIGVTRSAVRECPRAEPASGWTVTPLFPYKGRGEKLERIVLEAGLQHYCVAEYEGPDPEPVLPRSLRLRFRRAEPDSLAITTAGSPLQRLTAAPFFRRFGDEVERPSHLVLDVSAVPRVRLAFLDTQPTGVGVPVRPGAGAPALESEHGFSLLQIAGYLQGMEPAGLAGAPPVGAVNLLAGPLQIASRLALPFPRPEVGLGGAAPVERSLPGTATAGGAIGGFGDLQRALWEEVSEWIAPRAGAVRPDHLVLNLSLGWDGERFGGREDLSEGVAIPSIYETLRIAAANDILVFAAAGNERPGPDGAAELPLLPAGWQAEGPWRRGQAHGRPLVRAVSGVDGRDHPLVNTRARGEAPLVAYGDHAVVPDIADGRVHTGALTGTSVSTAVVSTIAALVWSQSSGLSAGGVMDRLAASAPAIPRRPDFASSGGEVRRISLCPTLAAVCPECAAYCPVPRPPLAPIEAALAVFEPDQAMSGTALSQLASPTENCTVAPIFYDPDHPPQTPCPSATLPNLADQPWIDTQPGVDPCPDCTVTRIGGGSGGSGLWRWVAPGIGTPFGTFSALPFLLPGEASRFAGPYRLRVAIPAEYQSYDLQGATLEIYGFDEDGRKEAKGGCSIGGNLQEGTSLAMTDLCFSDVPADFQAVLTFILAPHDSAPGSGIFSIQSPLFVE